MPRTYAQTEDEKYSWLFEHGYGNGPVQATLDWALPKLKPWRTVVDLGCGEASARLHLNYDRYVGVDIASRTIAALDNACSDGSSFFLHGNLEELDLAEHFDLAICIDVLQHIPANRLLPAVMDRIVAVADQLLVSVCTVPSRHVGEHGENLHLTVRAFKWWLDRFKTRARIVHTDGSRTLICQPLKGGTTRLFRRGK